MTVLITKEKRTILTWEHKDFGLFEACFWDGKLTDLRFCKNGSGTNTGLYTNDIKFCEAVKNALTDMFDILNKGNI